MSAEDFVARILVDRLGVGAVVVGWDFHFGKGRAGSAGDSRRGWRATRLRRRDRRQGRRRRGRRLVESSIREALERGDLAAAAKGLGRNYSVSGRGDRGSAPGTHARRADREYRARADQPARARHIRCRGPDRRARLSGGRELRHEADGRRRPAPARGPSPRFRRRPLWARIWRSSSSSASATSASSIRSTRSRRKWSATRRGRAPSCSRAPLSGGLYNIYYQLFVAAQGPISDDSVRAELNGVASA